MPDRTKKPYSRPTSANGGWLHDKAPTAPKAAARPNSKLVVSNLHYEVTQKDLETIFGQIGTLTREPQIRYDRSGRSSGVAHIFFETTVEATRAKKQFDGILAKGQPMSIVFDTSTLVRDSGATTSLLHRIQKPPLLDRLSRNESASKTPTRPRGRVGPIRTRTRAPKPLVKREKTVEQLDEELDAFMGDGEDIVPAVADV